MFKIALLGHSFCCPNFGLGALAYGEVDALKEACEKAGINEFSIECFETKINNLYFDGATPHVKLREFNVKHVISSARTFREYDLIIDVSGGDSFSDIYGDKLYVAQMLVKIAIMLSRVPYIIAPQTIGPFKKKYAQLFANCFVCNSNKAFARDKISYKALSKKVRNKIISVVDLAFLMKCDAVPKNDMFTIGFNVSGLLYHENKIVGNVQYKNLCKKIIKHLVEKKFKVLLIPHVVSDDVGNYDNDYPICEELANEFGLPPVIKFNNPKQVKTYISQCNLFIGSRMHATIAAVSMGVPTLPLAYSRKFKGVFETLDYPYTLDINCISEKDVLERIDYMINNNDEILRQLVDDLKRVNVLKETYVSEISKTIISLRDQK